MGSRRRLTGGTIDLDTLEAKVAAVLDRERARQSAESERLKIMQEVLRVAAPVLPVLATVRIPLSNATHAETWGEPGLLISGAGPCGDEDVCGWRRYVGATGSLLDVDYFSPDPDDDPGVTWIAKVGVIPAGDAAAHLVEVGDDENAITELVRAIDEQLPQQSRPSRAAARSDSRQASGNRRRRD